MHLPAWLSPGTTCPRSASAGTACLTPRTAGPLCPQPRTHQQPQQQRLSVRAMASSSKSLSFELVEIENPKELNFILGHGEQLIPAAPTLEPCRAVVSGCPYHLPLVADACLRRQSGLVSGLSLLPPSSTPSPSLCVATHLLLPTPSLPPTRSAHFSKTVAAPACGASVVQPLTTQLNASPSPCSCPTPARP